MDFSGLLKTRRSIRSYKADPIPQKAVDALALSVASAPTACNRQPVKVLFVTKPELRARISEVYSADWLKKAPAIAVVLVDAQSAWKRLEGDSIADVDGAIVMENLVLAAASEGLGTCWICAFDRAAMDAALGVSAPWRSFAITPVGYPDGEPAKIAKKSINSLFLEIK